MHYRPTDWLAACVLLLSPTSLQATGFPPPLSSLSSVIWHQDYHAGLDEAERRRKFALVWFFDPAAELENERFESEILDRPQIGGVIDQHYVAIKLDIHEKVLSGGHELLLIHHPSFAQMLRWPGLALVDMTDPKSPHFRQVVSVYPFNHGPISAEKLAVLLDLPRGSLTQRTLIFAVRTHPEHPASTTGHLSPLLTRETENHAWHQASITLQGHHNWSSRFHAINAELPGGLLAKEVCAQSWPGQTLVEAAEQCVNLWRRSPSHWQAIRSEHVLFGYDMKLGADGVWYAAGIFAGRD